MLVLLVDDDTEVQEFLAEVLRHEGHQVLCASDGLEALALLQAAHPDCIFLDLEMPGMDGPAFCAHQHRLAPACACVPVIVHSSHPQARRLARELGAAGVLPKGCLPLEVVQTLLQVTHPRLHAGPGPIALS